MLSTVVNMEANTNKKALILGYGEMGHAFESLLAGRFEYRVWTRRPEAGSSTDLAALSADADLVVFCLPVVAHQAVAEALAHSLPETSLCLSIAKGLDEQGRPAEAILRASLPGHPHALMYGPMISEEIRADRPAFAQVGTRRGEDYERVRAWFDGSRLSLQHSDDIPGISWSVILKNVYAILFGVADQLELGDNMRGHLMVTALQELSAIVTEMGGRQMTPYGLAGLGDLTTTATSESSHHHSLGRCLASDACEQINGEGVHTLQMVDKYRLFNFDDYPLFSLAMSILRQPHLTSVSMREYLQSLQQG